MAHLPEDLQASLRWSSIVHRRVRGFLVPKLPLLCVSSPFLRTIQCSFAPHTRISNAYQAPTMECLDREPQPTRQASSTALVETASGQNDQKPRKRDVSATNEQPCDAHGTGTGRAPRTALRPPLGPHDAADDDAFARRGLSVVDLGLGTSFLAFDENASVEPSNGAQLTKKLCLRAPPTADESRLAASALAGGLVFRDPGRSLQNNNAGWRVLLPGVERAAPEQAPRLEWRRFFPLLGVSPASDGSGLFYLRQKRPRWRSSFFSQIC